MAADTSASMMPISPFTIAAARLMRASAWICAGSSPRPEMGKFSTARCVWAAYSASRGTRTSPIVSCSMRNSSALLGDPGAMSATLLLSFGNG